MPVRLSGSSCIGIMGYAEITPGNLSLSQPCIHPIFDTRAFQDSLLKWSGSEIKYHDYIQDNWKKAFLALQARVILREFWVKSLKRGVFTFKAPELKSPEIKLETIGAAIESADGGQKAGFEIQFYPSVSIGNGKHSNNPWLMELPDPVVGMRWDNVASLSPMDAQELGIVTGDAITLGDNFRIPAFIQPGQAKEVFQLPSVTDTAMQARWLIKLELMYIPL